MRKVIKRIGAAFLAVLFLVTQNDIGDRCLAVEAENPVIVIPFADQWKYYGQPKTFLKDEHYILCNEPDEFSSVNWRLMIQNEEIGTWPFVISYSENASAADIKLAENSPKFEVREYTTPVEVASIADQTRTESVTIPAPSDYQISTGKDAAGNWNWADKIETGTLTQGNNQITYYLRSIQNDTTKYAIDSKAKTTNIFVDSIAPRVTSLLVGASASATASTGSITGNEPGKFYYMVMPENSDSDEDCMKTAAEIKEHVKCGYGIVGYGRVDGTHATDIEFSGLTPETTYRIYAFMEDKLGNYSEVVSSVPFSTDKSALTGDVNIQGIVEEGNILTVSLETAAADPGAVSYQWYRVKKTEDETALNADIDETGGAEADVLDAVEEDPDNSEDSEEDEDSLDGNNEVNHYAAEMTDTPVEDVTTLADITTLDDAVLIEGATSNTYKITKEDIGYRLIVCAEAENYSGNVIGGTNTFVPKLIPEYTLPTVQGGTYSPSNTLASVALPEQWSWVDNTIVPVYGNMGYRAKFVPTDEHIYKSVVLRIIVPITQAELKKSMVSVPESEAYRGEEIKDNFTIEDHDTELVAGKDYEVEYMKNKKLGKARIEITGKGNYTGTVNASYIIKKKSIRKVTCKFKPAVVYNGKKRKAELVLKNGSVEMEKNTDYKVTYKNNKKIGRAKAVIKGIGNYTGTKTIYFSIVPQKPSIKKVERKKGSFQLKFASKQRTTGYYVYVSTNRSFDAATTQQFVATGNTFGMNGLNKDQEYYIRIKTYSSIKGKIYESAYSDIKKVKIK